MSTLKVQLGLTLTALLSLSMLLFGLVLLILWQRNEIKQETLATEHYLKMAATAIVSHQNESVLPPGISNFLREKNITCIQWNSRHSSVNHSHGSCSEQELLVKLLRKTTSGVKKINLSGMIWNGLFFSRQSLLIALPLQEQQNGVSAIGAIRSLEDLVTPIKNIRKIFFAYLVLNVLIFATIGFTRLVNLIVRPIQRLTQLADSRTNHNDSAFFTEERWGEFTQLSSSLNHLVSRIDGDKQQLQTMVQSLKQANKELQKNRDEMIRTEKLASIGRLSAGLAHEIGNPLGIIQGYVDLLGDETLTVEDRKVFSKKTVQELDRINNLIRNLLDLSRAPTASTISTISIHQLLRDIIETIHIRKTAVEISYETDFTATKDLVTVDSDGLRQVFLNCILNAIDAIEEQTEVNNGKIRVTTEDENDDTITISIRDNGAGLGEKHLESVFDPFFTTKEVGKGTGLGLAVAHNMIKTSGGTLHFSSKEGRGSAIHISLPIAEPGQEKQ